MPFWKEVSLSLDMADNKAEAKHLEIKPFEVRLQVPSGEDLVGLPKDPVCPPAKDRRRGDADL